jgi:hypothetical protein
VNNYWAGVSGQGNRIIPRWRQNKKRKGLLSARSDTNIYHLPPSLPPLFLIGHYLQRPVPLDINMPYTSVSHGNDLFLADRVICGVAMVIIPGGVVFANHAVLAVSIAGLTLSPLHIVPGRPISPNPLSLCKRKAV